MSKQKLLSLQKRKCYWCGCKLQINGKRGGKPATWDHLTPTSRGGSNLLYNKRLTCSSCNCRKGSKTGPEYVLFCAEQQLQLWVGRHEVDNAKELQLTTCLMGIWTAKKRSDKAPVTIRRLPAKIRRRSASVIYRGQQLGYY